MSLNKPNLTWPTVSSLLEAIAQKQIVVNVLPPEKPKCLWFDRTIDGEYVDGISITYGLPRQHIWTYASGKSEVNLIISCPCRDNSTSLNPPSFVANNYYCESGNPRNTFEHTNVLRYTDDPLWDGLNCERQCCSDGRNPPWFSVQLTERTTSDIEVRICENGPIDEEDTPIELLELYVQ